MTSNLNRALEWTSPQTQPLLLGALCFLALTLFSMAVWPKLKLLWSARSAGRCDRVFERIALTLKVAFGQSKLMQEKGAGWMHALIFWGFLILLFRAAEFFFIGFFPETDFSFPAGNALFMAYAWVKDVAVLLVGLAVSFALYRRLVIKPQRLTLSGEGLLILLLILAIMVSDVLFDSAFLALHPEGHSGPIGMALAPVFGILGKSILGNLHSLAYWLHTSSILFFLILLPRSKHFHILTSIPNVFFSNFGTNLSRIDFEEEESFGVINSKDFNWKQMLDLHTCTQCGRCDRACPAWATGKPLSPQQLTVDLRDHLNGPLSTDTPLLGGIIDDEVLWSCTTCGACEAACPVMIGYVDKVIDLRRGLVLTEDRYPKEFTTAFKSLETQSNPWGFPKGSRSDWAKDLGIPIWDKTKPTEYLYFVGCNGSFDTRGKKIAEAVVQTLKEAGVEFSILGNSEGCTGDPARRAGNEYLFDMLASANAETFKEQGVRKVVTHCPHCLNSLKNEYPEFGATLEVIHHSELLQKLIKEGKISTQQKTEENIVFHDSCYLGRHNEIYEAPREVLNASTKPDSIKEVEQSRETGTCCGAGGARFLLEENTGTRMSHHRLDELMVTEPDTIAVSCPFCVLMLEDAVKAKNLKVQIKDIGEILVKKN
jgi:Fe-S oxidoreductase/nitrate reductase gamma subunit